MYCRLFVCGDYVNTLNKKDFIDKQLIDLIKSVDISICNFEAPIKHENLRPVKKAGPHVYQSKESITYLKQSGFNFVSLANNHIYDYGQQALVGSILELKKNGLQYIGAGGNFREAYRTKIIEKNDLKIGLLSGCENEFGCLHEEQSRGGYAWLFHYKIEDNIRKLKDECDFIVLVAHAGVEDIDFPIKEWRDRYKRLCDIGVDVVIGHHPHVPQGYDRYGKSLIFYSLGNFYFDTASFVNKSDDSYSVVLEFEREEEVKFELIYHKKVDGQTCLVDKGKVDFDVEYLNSLLKDGYLKRNDEVSIELFNKYYYSYYEYAMGIVPKKATLLSRLKWLVKTIFFPYREQDEKNLMLLHNIKIDSHRFVVQRALSLMSEKG